MTGPTDPATLLQTNAKLDKAVPGVRIVGLSLLPHTLAGGANLCPYSTPECRAVCLVTTGLNRLPVAHRAKLRRTQAWLNNPAEFRRALWEAVRRHSASCDRAGLKAAVRLNVYSDIRWEREYPQLFEAFPEVQFYDYTKWPMREREQRPVNYHLTYSYSGTPASVKHAQEWATAGVNSAVVFEENLPATWNGLRVVAGDDTDYRPHDPVPCVVGLTYKGPKAGLVNIRRFVQRSK